MGENFANMFLRAWDFRIALVTFPKGSQLFARSDEEGMRITVDGLRLLAPLAEQAGVNLVLELLNSKVDHVGYQADRAAGPNLTATAPGATATRWVMRPHSPISSSASRIAVAGQPPTRVATSINTCMANALSPSRMTLAAWSSAIQR